MQPVLFSCPATGANVQAWLAEEVTGDDDTYVAIECIACRRVHLVQPKTGKTLGRSPSGGLL